MSEAVVVPGPAAAADPVCCPRHALCRPLLTGAGWLAAAVAALSVAAVPYDPGEALCGVWGCFPPVPALAAMHLFWGVLMAAGVWAVRRWRPRLLKAGGAVVFAASGLAAVAVVGRDVLDWLHWVPADAARLWPRRAAYVLATKTDLPLVQVMAAGVAGVALAGAAGRGRSAVGSQSGTFEGGMKYIMVVVVVVGVLGVTWAVGRGEKPDGGPKPAGPSAPAPEFAGITDWVNTKGLKLADQKGKVVVVHFWTNGCINCVNNYPHYRAWQDKYKDEKGFLMVGVHTPEFDAEKDLDRLKERVAKNKLTFAVAVDTDAKTWKAWGNRYWPCVYLVDKAGAVRHKWEGELGADGYKAVTARIDELLAEPAPGK